MTDDRKCDNSRGAVKGIMTVCQSMERCDGHGGGVRGLAYGRYDTVVRTCDSPQGRVRV